jgi:hypothetical protein
MERFKYHTEKERWVDTEHNVVMDSEYDCGQAGPTGWTMKVGNTADFLIQLCPWYMKQFEDKEFAYITRNALNAAKALSTNPPSTLLDTPGRKLTILSFLIPSYSMRFVLRLSPAPTKADHA